MKARLIIFALFGLFALGLFSPETVAAFNLFSNCSTTTNSDGSKTQTCGPCKDQPSAPVCQQNTQQLKDKTNPVLTKVHDATNLLALIAAAAAVVLIVYAGFQFATAGGSSENATKTKEARGTITGALVGLVIIALAWTIVTFVTSRVIKT